MNVKQCVIIEVTKDAHSFSFSMPHGSTWGQALDASFEILNKISTMSQESVNRAKPQGEDDGTK